MTDPSEDLKDIEALRTSKPFQRYFLRRMGEKLKVLEQTILEAKPDDTSMEAKHKRAVIQELQKMMDQDESTFLKTMKPTR